MLPFLSGADRDRACHTFRKLARYGVRWALTGSAALETLCARPEPRPLNDLDFVTEAFAEIQRGLSGDFLFRHVHQFDPPGRILLQLVDPETALRVDLFRAEGRTLHRTLPVELPWGRMAVVSVDDLAARAARLLLDLKDGIAVASKHARDYVRLVELVDPLGVEAAWIDHRKPGQPQTFAEADAMLRELIPARPHLLVTPAYSQDVRAVCPRCAGTVEFPLGDPVVIQSILGYC